MKTWIVVLFLVSTNLSASIITYDESYFYSKYTNPTEVIDFSVLKDGTTHNDLVTNASSTALSLGRVSSIDLSYAVWEYAWSDNVYFRGSHGGGGFVIATNWDGRSIKLNNSPRQFSIYLINGSSPIALTVESSSYTGFMGIIPENDTERHFEFGNKELSITSFASGFSTVPEPSILSLFVIGLLFLAKKSKPLNPNNMDYP